MAGESILILGVGNVLMRDEGIGPRIVEEIERHYTLPENVSITDAGTLGLGMMYLFRGVDYLLVADAVNGTGHEPGTVVRITPDDFAPNQVMHSLHDMRLVDVLQAADLVGIKPETECIGVQVLDIAPEEFSIGLTDALEASVPRAVAAVLMLLEERGAIARELPGLGPDAMEFRAAVLDALNEMRDRRANTGSSADYSA
ncbi:MAG: HyaD/HybD family hydrogenase maturation endopeptidase [Coriobacteriia bacterium]